MSFLEKGMEMIGSKKTSINTTLFKYSNGVETIKRGYEIEILEVHGKTKVMIMAENLEKAKEIALSNAKDYWYSMQPEEYVAICNNCSKDEEGE